MKKHDWTRITVVLAIVTACCWLAQLPLYATAQGYFPHIPGGEAKIPRSVLKRIRTIRPGMTREKFYKLFVLYTVGLRLHGSAKGGKSTRIFHYVYRFAYVPSGYTKGIEKPDTTHWEVGKPDLKEPPIPAGTLILVDVAWTYAKDGSKDATVGNPDDVITHISKPYLIFGTAAHA